MSTYAVEPVPTPAAAGGIPQPDWRLHGMADLDAAHLRDVLGNTDLAETAREMATSLANQRNADKIALVAVDPQRSGEADAVLGSAWVHAPTSDNTHTAYIYINVRSSRRRRGIGTALWRQAMAWALEHGRTTLTTSTSQAGEPVAGEDYTLEPSTGCGRIDTREAGVQFARQVGFSLAQVERHSVQSLPVDPQIVENFRREATETAGPDYELVTWQDTVPEEWLGELVTLHTAMSRDVPHGDLDYGEEVWNAERIRYRERINNQLGRRIFNTAARHLPTGELAAHTEIYVDTHKPGVAYQENTIVLRAHRGHRLGMAVKATNLAWLQREEPSVQRVHTWNAQENEHMLAINVALGYQMASAWGEWQQKLTHEPG